MSGVLSTCLIFMLVSVFYQVSATTYSIKNSALRTAGGLLFYREVGHDEVLAVMGQAKDFIARAFSLGPQSRIDHVTLFVEDFHGIAYTFRGNIYLSAGYVQYRSQLSTSALRKEIAGLLYHEMTHVCQNSAEGIPAGVIEGIADFIRLRAGLGTWIRQAAGKWDDGYSTKAFFFDWIDKKKTHGFVNRLNKIIGDSGWNVTDFVAITGESVRKLWKEYQSSI
ncbi:hypothetical protein Mapa_012777 [Marchantia paleacea]|nr:hypothetical protein Mapa_012777 [Marchantia paleacea]